MRAKHLGNRRFQRKSVYCGREEEPNGYGQCPLRLNWSQWSLSAKPREKRVLNRAERNRTNPPFSKEHNLDCGFPRARNPIHPAGQQRTSVPKHPSNFYSWKSQARFFELLPWRVRCCLLYLHAQEGTRQCDRDCKCIIQNVSMLAEKWPFIPD